ncbi:MAG: GNAT family N-acetyltransferase [Clostridia bacterium]|nr:GNAT family N-acetyltransferase [Clostridia bacterium]MBR1821159.1 GNAT family N-acetyltransferase [Clostridia bacterium]
MKLRKLALKDAPFMLEWMHDASVTAFMKANFAAKTLADCEAFISAAQDTDSNLHLAITDEADEYMGTVSLKHIANRTAEFGITVRKCAMGKGYSRFGMSEILKTGLRELGLEKIYWCVSPDNGRAVRFYDKQGYARGGAPAEAQGYSDEEKHRYIWYEVTEL